MNWQDTFNELKNAADPENYNPSLTIPTTATLSITARILAGLRELNLQPPEVTPDGDGGLWVEWINGQRPYIKIG